MNLVEVFLVLQWWVFLFILGILFLPLTSKIFSIFPDKGYAFSKSIGIIFLSYFTFLLGVFHVIPFSRPTLFLIIIIFAGLQLYRFRLSAFEFLKTHKKLLVIEELLFLGGLFLWTYVRGFAPEIHGLEKYMDYGFINSILRSNYFPPKDMWLTPESINYYYFGHLVTAVLTKLTDIPSRITYNLMLGTLVGMTLTSSFSIGITLIAKASNHIKTHFARLLAAGILTALLVTFAGNLHTVYTMYKPYENEKPVPFWELQFSGINPCYGKQSYVIEKNGKKETVRCSAEEEKTISLFPNSYWYPNATRFIYNTIHEFPIYSWVVADLHGHVLDIPFVLLTIAFALSLFLKSQISNAKSPGKQSLLITKMQKVVNFHAWNLDLGNLIFGGFLLSVMYMTNAWDGLIYLMLFVFLFFFIFWKNSKQKSLGAKAAHIFPTFFVSSAIIFLSFIFFALPFSIFFKPFASGVGILCAPDFLLRLKELGPFLFEQNHCARSPWWQLLILYGFFYFFVISFIAFLIKTKKIVTSDIFVILLIIASTVLIIVPEFIYLKDIYPEHYRANTMFKLVFQAFIMLSISSGYIIVRIISSIKYRALSIKSLFLLIIFLTFTIPLLTLVFIYPFQATGSYYGNLANYKGVDGLKYLKESYPNDYAAIEWMNKSIKGQPVVLEAQGDSYTDYARVSVNTGLPTILGWTVHEWLWRGSYDVPAPRIAEIQTLYETTDLSKTEKLLKKYNVNYVFVGDLERQKYPNLEIGKFNQLGKVVYQNGNTIIYRID